MENTNEKMENKKKKFAGYLRCSTHKQELDSQIYVLSEWAKKNNYEIDFFQDYAVSGRKASRQGLDEMMKKCKNGYYKGVVVVEISRFGRSIKLIYQIIEELTSLGLEIVLANSNTRLIYNSVEGRALIGGLALAADLEWMLISERNKRGREKIRREKIKVGRRRAEDKGVSLDAVLLLKHKGLGYRAIAKEMNTSIATISRMIKRYEVAQQSNVSKSNSPLDKLGSNQGSVSFDPIQVLKGGEGGELKWINLE